MFKQIGLRTSIVVTLTMIYETDEFEKKSHVQILHMFNNRIRGIFCTLMESNGILYGENERKRIADNTLVALTLMTAESRTEEKDLIVKVVVN